MADIFSSCELIELGVQIEVNGRDFYQELSSRAKDIKLRELFKFLAAEEGKHIGIFNEISEKQLCDKDKEFNRDEYFAYMNSLARNYVFTERDTGKKEAIVIKDEKEGVEKAIGFEKDSIVFYEGMRKIVPEKKTVDLLIAQEKMHLKKLTEMLSEI